MVSQTMHIKPVIQTKNKCCPGTVSTENGPSRLLIWPNSDTLGAWKPSPTTKGAEKQ